MPNKSTILTIKDERINKPDIYECPGANCKWEIYALEEFGVVDEFNNIWFNCEDCGTSSFYRRDH